MESTTRYRFFLIALLAVSALLAGCSRVTPVHVTNRNSFSVEVQLIDSAEKATDIVQVPPKSAARIGWLYRPGPFEYTLRVARVLDKHRTTGIGATSSVLGEHVIGDIDFLRLHYIVEGSVIIASNDEPQDPETLAIKRRRMKFFYEFVGIVGCILTVVRLYKQRRITSR